MANYSLVVNSRFRPFEYQELLAPVLMATQAHQAVEEQYADLATKASVWDGLTEGSERAHRMYTDYAKALDEAADELAKHGLNPTSRQAMFNMRSRYAKEIAPIERAYELRAEDIKRQQDVYDKTGGRTIFSKKAKEVPLDDYLSGNSLSYETANLDKIADAGMAGGKAISSRYFKTEEGKRFNGDYYSLIKKTGLSPEEALEVLKGSGKYPEFERFVNDTLLSYGYDNFDPQNQAIMRGALNQGINTGIVYGETESLQNNWRAQKALEHYYHEAEADAAATREISKARQIAGIKAAADRANQIGNLFTPVIPQGVTGEPDKDLDRLEGFKKVAGAHGEIGVSTNKLDKLAKNVERTKEALEDYEKRYPAAKNNPISATGQGGTTLYSSWYNKGQDSAARDYAKWRMLKEDADKAKAEFDEEWNYLDSFAKQYSGYGDNMYDRIKFGRDARQAHLGQQKLFYGLNLNESSRNEVRTSIGELASAGAFVERTKDKKKITGEKLTSLLDDAANTAVGVTVDKDKVFLSLNDKEGKEYKIKGVRHIEDFNERLSYINKKLGDFYSPRTTGNIYDIPANFTGNYIDALTAAIKAGKAEHPRETDMYAATIRIPIDGRTELINVVTDGKDIYFQTLSDELYNKGKNREAVISNAAAAALADLLPTLAHTPLSKEEEK